MPVGYLVSVALVALVTLFALVPLRSVGNLSFRLGLLLNEVQAEAVDLYEAPASGNYWAASCVSGRLIQATVGRAGGWGGLPTNRSG